MREWLLCLCPVGVVAYFLVYPDQLGGVVILVNGLIH